MVLAPLRDVSLIWLVLLTFVAVLPFGVLFYLGIRGMHWVRQFSKRTLPVVQDKARLVADTADRISLRVAAPVIGARATAARVRGIRSAAFRRKQA